MKKLFYILFIGTLWMCTSCDYENLVPLAPPATVQSIVEIGLNDGTDVNFNAGTVYITDFNPGVPNTTLLVISDASSNIDLDGNNNLKKYKIIFNQCIWKP